MPRRPLLAAGDRAAAGLPRSGPLPASTHLRTKAATRAFLAARVEKNLEIIAKIAEGADEASVRLRAATYLVDRYLGRIPSFGEGKTPVEQGDADAAGETFHALARDLLRDLPHEQARRAVEAIREGLVATGKLSPNSRAGCRDSPTA